MKLSGNFVIPLLISGSFAGVVNIRQVPASGRTSPGPTTTPAQALSSTKTSATLLTVNPVSAAESAPPKPAGVNIAPASGAVASLPGPGAPKAGLASGPLNSIINGLGGQIVHKRAPWLESFATTLAPYPPPPSPAPSPGATTPAAPGVPVVPGILNSAGSLTAKTTLPVQISPGAQLSPAVPLLKGPTIPTAAPPPVLANSDSPVAGIKPSLKKRQTVPTPLRGTSTGAVKGPSAPAGAGSGPIVGTGGVPGAGGVPKSLPPAPKPSKAGS